LDVKREHEIRIGKKKFGSKWGGVEQILRGSGTIQLWKVLERDELVSTREIRRRGEGG